MAKNSMLSVARVFISRFETRCLQVLGLNHNQGKQIKSQNATIKNYESSLILKHSDYG